MNGRWIPNAITLLRIALVLPIGLSLAEERFGRALGLMLAAGISDGLDGWLARRCGWQTKLGGYLDPLADKLLIGVVYATLAAVGLLPWWLAVLVILRDAVIVCGAIAFEAVTSRLTMTPLLLSKLNTFVQIALAVVVIVGAGFVPLPAPVIGVLVPLVAATTLASGGAYVLLWQQKAREGRA